MAIIKLAALYRSCIYHDFKPAKHFDSLKTLFKVKVKFTLEQAMKVQLYSSFNLGTRWDGWSTPRHGRFTPGNDPVPIVQEAG
jgi:hypothetical protein